VPFPKFEIHPSANPANLLNREQETRPARKDEDSQGLLNAAKLASQSAKPEPAPSEGGEFSKPLSGFSRTLAESRSEDFYSPGQGKPEEFSRLATLAEPWIQQQTLLKGCVYLITLILTKALEPITGFAAKLPDYTLRLAGVLTLFANPEAGYIGKEYVESAIALAQFYGNEALRLVGGYRIPRTLARAQEVLTWIITRTQGRNPRLVYLAEVYQAGPSEVRSAKAAREVLRLLEEHNYLAHRQNVEVGGVTRRDAWEVNPRAISQV